MCSTFHCDEVFYALLLRVKSQGVFRDRGSHRGKSLAVKLQKKKTAVGRKNWQILTVSCKITKILTVYRKSHHHTFLIGNRPYQTFKVGSSPKYCLPEVNLTFRIKRSFMTPTELYTITWNLQFLKDPRAWCLETTPWKKDKRSGHYFSWRLSIKVNQSNL